MTAKTAHKKEKSPPKKKGRYRKEMPVELLEAGEKNPYFYTDKEIAKVLGVSQSSVSRWKNAHPEFKKACDELKDQRNILVENSLLKKALGYQYEEVKVVQNPDGSTRREITSKHVPPSDTACIFWLKTKAPNDWRDVQEHVHTVRPWVPEFIIPIREEALP